MKNIKFLFLLILMGCSASKVIVDYDTEVDFSDFTSYAFYDDIGEGLSELDVKRVTSILEKELKALDIKSDENPKMFVNVISKITEQQSNNTIGIGIGTRGRNSGIGVSGGIPIGGKKLIETFKIEFVNAATNTLIWEATLTSTIKEKRPPEIKAAHFNMIIKKMLARYVPKK